MEPTFQSHDGPIRLVLRHSADGLWLFRVFQS